MLHGFNAVFWTPNERWLLLDASGAIDGETTRVRFEPPWSLAYVPDSSKHEGFLPAIRRRPEKRIIDLLERAPDFETIRRNLPDGF